MLRLEYAKATQKGRKGLFSKNEDALAVNKSKRLFILADGMGGHKNAELASKIAVKAISSHFNRNQPHKLYLALLRAHDEITAENLKRVENPETAPYDSFMGSTAVAAHFSKDDLLHVSNVGDSRAYVFRKGVLKQLSMDDSDPVFRHQLDQALGDATERPKPHAFKFKPEKGDLFLLCSDGITDALKDAHIAEVMKKIKNSKSLKKASYELLKAVRKRKKLFRDDASVILIKVNAQKVKRNGWQRTN